MASQKKVKSAETASGRGIGWESNLSFGGKVSGECPQWLAEAEGREKKITDQRAEGVALDTMLETKVLYSVFLCVLYNEEPPIYIQEKGLSIETY